MFVDEVEIEIESGKGGNGCMSFRHEKFVPRGGPDGGDGGRGGSVVLEADPNLGTLLDFRHMRRFKAGNGQPGMGNRKFGKSGEDRIIAVPTGTIVHDATTGKMIADLVARGERLTVARGGHGGKGNYKYRSSTNRAPRRADSGGKAENLRLRLTLKLIADVGLVGLPNAGKSTLLSQISRARPKIADYPFTTLAPNLGIVSVREWQSFVVADIPGIVEGAHEGRGLGHRFLRHIERTRVLAFLIDVSSPDPGAVYRTLLEELRAFSRTLLTKPRMVVYTKADLHGDEPMPEPPEPGLPCRLISAVTGAGIPELVNDLYVNVRELDARELADRSVGDRQELD